MTDRPVITLDPILAELQRKAAEERQRAAQYTAEARACERAAEAYEEAVRTLVAAVTANAEEGEG